MVVGCQYCHILPQSIQRRQCNLCGGLLLLLQHHLILPWIHCITWSINEPFSHCYTLIKLRTCHHSLSCNNICTYFKHARSRVRWCLRSSLTRVGSKGGVYELTCPQKTSSSFNAIIHVDKYRIIFYIVGFPSSWCPSLLYKPSMDPLCDIDCNRERGGLFLSHPGDTLRVCTRAAVCVYVQSWDTKEISLTCMLSMSTNAYDVDLTYSLSLLEECTCGNDTIILFLGLLVKR